ncbi:MAG: hypothetical protein A2508_08385 [Candidatus Lambdaproteobacteria bacterium RIFOXYD12_FULL_49_8]|uniref:Non-canonical purine NTP pyrophosphatase, RdgB/HAM1 family n=1 Tax=Candidatus Lambdaproteobacteria bacterium RIFOXYD2_FULL_50_16 TaxID=1817772 RepID=A0A1F6G5Z8_9PROT|nr:MAG: hypothetical protein A2527_11565 [Candidatus Lambdaproteobacteria bacterium RIFOXYD2_FULL_50_16]OGG98036.1 MAG: hypothetical protein A2508_08385 [Candidatus Lambdaproteobacteria bacterium RIFOXYD12_FULL_49_8]
MKPKRLLLITGNRGKAAEFQSLLGGLELAHKRIDLIEIQSLDAQEIGLHKAKEALSQLNEQEKLRYDAVLTDDTSLRFLSLGGFPGALVKPCLDALGPAGLANLLIDKSKEAEALCLLSLGLVKTGEVLQFEGLVPGQIGPPQGDQGFGWDAIFYPQGQNLSYAQLSSDQKNQISHRTLAVKALQAWLG